MRIQNIMGYVMLSVAFTLADVIVFEFCQLVGPSIDSVVIVPVILSVGLLAQLIVFLLCGNIGKSSLVALLLATLVLEGVLSLVDVPGKAGFYLLLLLLLLIDLMSITPQFLSLYYTNMALAASFITSTVLVLFLVMMPNRWAIVVLGVVLLVSGCSLTGDIEIFNLPKDSSGQRPFVRSHLRDVVSVVTAGILAGLAVVFLASFNTLMLPASFVPVGLGAAISFLYFHKHDRAGMVLRRWLSILCMAISLLIIAVPLDGKLICCAVLLLFVGMFLGNKIYLTFFLFEYSRRNLFTIFSMFLLGMLVGGICACMVYRLGSDSLSGNSVTIYIFQLTTLLLFVEYYVLGVPQEKGAAAEKDDGFLKSSSKAVSGPSNENNEGFLKTRCSILSQEYRLSARQQEVLLMLAKGRNAQYISDSLRISRSTAKTHIYNIYQKFEIGSQQELISIVEER